MSLQDKIALITGASRGIGAAIAIELGKQEATVVGTATTQVGADKISAALDAAGVQGRGIVLNVTESDSIAASIGQINSEVGAPTILVNNAGITRDNLMLRMKDDEWHNVIDTNLSSVYRLVRACLKPMVKARWGRIINISSVSGLMGNAGQVNYAAAKAGMIGFTKSLARELGSRGITANAVAPGFIATDMTAELTADQKASILEQVAINRLGVPEDIAAAVSFLASEQASYITGETINVSGGMYMS